MFWFVKRLALVAAVVVFPATAAGSGLPTVAGSWRPIAKAPFSPAPGTSVWTGKRLIVFGTRPGSSTELAAAYDPAANAWTRLAPPAGPGYEPGYTAVWTGKEMLVWSAFHSLAFNPATNAWRPLRKPVPGGIIVWTGREAIGWGGGCCGDAWSNGIAYNAATGTYHNLPRSPLAASQRPLGAWTGRELLLFVSGFDPEGKPYPARLARAAAYKPATNRWRRIAPLPDTGMRFGDIAAWDGRELIVVGAGDDARATLAYNPDTNRWRRLARLPDGRVGASAVWTGTRLFVWGGQNAAASKPLSGGLAYDPRTDRWSSIPRAPFRARGGSMVAWTGRSLLVFGGEIGTPAGTSIPPRYLRDGAAFTPAR